MEQPNPLQVERIAELLFVFEISLISFDSSYDICIEEFTGFSTQQADGFSQIRGQD